MRLIDSTDDRLYTPCVKVDNPKSLSIKMLAKTLVKTMKLEGGIGLAAPQIGRNEAVFVMKYNNISIVCINPTISWYSPETTKFKERCLSFPTLTLELERPEKIIAHYTNINGKLVTESMRGIEARCFQHELDHLSGITFVEKYDQK